MTDAPDTRRFDHGKKQHWVVIAAFFDGQTSRWLDDFIDDDSLVFSKIGPGRKRANWHFQRGKVTGALHWLAHLSQARRAFAARPDGIITCFPQLAMCAALVKRLRRSKIPVIAYNYNLGGFPGGMRRRIARFAASAIDRFVVHSPSEVGPYAAYLGVDPARVRFVPLQRGDTDVVRAEDTETPFIVSMGSAHRDYATLVAAVDALRIPTVIVTRPADIDTLPKSEWVSFRSNLSPAECHALLARARLSVTPIGNLTTASGQITFVDALRLGVPVIATRCPGTDGYIMDGKTGCLVTPFDVDDMKTQIDALWRDPDLRARLSANAVADARERFTDAAAAAQLHTLIKDVR